MQNSADIARQLADYDKNAVTSAGAFNEAAAQFGLPEIRSKVGAMRTTLTNTQNAYNQVDPSVTGRTAGTWTNEAQRTRRVALERQPIAEAISSQGNQLSQSEQDLKDATSNATTFATNRVNDYNAGRSALQSRYDMSYRTEQDTAAREASRIAAERQQANADREFALASRTAASKTTGPTKTDVASHIVQSFNSLRGKDGKVSNETWQNALNDWTAIGGTVRDFWKAYGDYVNPKFKSTYAGYVNR